MVHKKKIYMNLILKKYKKILKLKKINNFFKFKYFHLLKKKKTTYRLIRSLLHSLNFYSFRKLVKNFRIDAKFYSARRLLLLQIDKLKNKILLNLNIYRNKYLDLTKQVKLLRFKYKLKNHISFNNFFILKKKIKVKDKTYFSLYRRFIMLMRRKKRLLVEKKLFKNKYKNYNYNNYIYNELNKNYYKFYNKNYNNFYNLHMFDRNYYRYRDNFYYIFGNLMKQYNKNYLYYFLNNKDNAFFNYFNLYKGFKDKRNIGQKYFNYKQYFIKNDINYNNNYNNYYYNYSIN